MDMNVVVVGAGAAGIVAARELHQQGVRPIVLEARERVGGRAWTDCTSLGMPLDMGCSWLRSADVNPWTAYARAHGFTVRERSPMWQRFVRGLDTTQAYKDAWFSAFRRNGQLIEEAVRAGRDVPVSSVVPNDEHRPLFDAVRRASSKHSPSMS